MSNSVSKKEYKKSRNRARNNAASRQTNDSIRAENGLSSDTKIVKLYQTNNIANPHLFTEGNMALVYNETGQVIFSARFIDLNKEPFKFVNQLKGTISTLYKHTTSHNLVTKNHAVVELPPDQRSGQMFVMGITGGRTDGTKTAPYSLNSTHGNNARLIQEDTDRLALLPEIEQFIGDLFMQQCTTFYGSNLLISEMLNALSYAASSPFSQPNGISYGGSFVLTRDEFVNAPHDDNDSTDYAVGLFGTVNRTTRFPIHLPEGEPHLVIIQNSHMRFPTYTTKNIMFSGQIT